MADEPDNNIAVEGLKKHYGDVEALKGIDFEVASGEIVGFVGPNGAGKTTTMKILGCISSPTAGTARVAGHDVDKHPDAVRRQIGVLPEDVPLYDEMLVYDFLKFVARLHDVDPDERRDRIREVVEQTGLTPVVERPIRELSKGFRQRVGLAQAIVHDPEVLILDEPTTGLDPNQIVEIRDVLTTIGRDNTILLSTHILQEVSAVCDRLVILDEGRIVADGTLEELRRRLAESAPGLIVEYDTDDPEGRAELLEGLDPVERVLRIGTPSGRIAFRLTGDPDELRDALFGLGEQSPEAIRPPTPDLEEIFRQFTTGTRSVEFRTEDSGPDLTRWMDRAADTADPSPLAGTDDAEDSRSAPVD